MTPTTVILAIAAYFIVLLIISRFAGRRATNATFFTGNRRAPWPLVAFAMVGAVMSGVTFISVPGMVVTKGYSYLQMCLGFFVGYAVIALVLIPLFYRKNLASIYGYLEQRFGRRTHKTGAWMFFLSEVLGASVRFFVVCAVMQLLVFDPLGIPFEVNAIVAVGLIWLYTVRGGVKTLIWTDVLKSGCLILSVTLCIVFIASALGLGSRDLISTVSDHPTSQVFNFSDPMSPTYFWKQFIAGVFMVIVMNGLNQDMMQRHLACRDSRSSRKNMMVSASVQIVVIGLFLVLGTLLLLYADKIGLAVPEKTDDLFGMIASHPSMPLIVGVLFVVGLVAAAYSAAGSAITSLTTSFTLDILDGRKRFDDNDPKLTRLRRCVHLMMAFVIAGVIIAFHYLSSDDAISAVYTLASLTYGPILGLFAYGLLTKRPVNDRWVPVVCFSSPFIAWGIKALVASLTGYQIGFELLLLNGLITIAGLYLLSPRKAYVEEYF